MKKVRKIIKWLLPHCAIILSAAFITFWILDYLNPMIGFLDNQITDILLLVFCIITLLTGILAAVLVWKSEHKGKKE